MARTNLRETLAAKVRELAENVPNDGHLVCSGEEGFRRGWYAGAASAAQLITESPELAEVEAIQEQVNRLDPLVRNRMAELTQLRAEVEALRVDAAERQAEFDLRWKADMRAIKRWQEATGRTMIWPDHADLCVWLMEQLEAANARQAT